MRLPINPPPPWVYAGRNPDGSLYVQASASTQALRHGEPAEVWGEFGYRVDNGQLVLIWTGSGCFQLQTGYYYPSDQTIHWFDEGGPREGPAEISVSEIAQGSPRYFRIVPCNEEEPE